MKLTPISTYVWVSSSFDHDYDYDDDDDDDTKFYIYVSKGKTKVDSIDDDEELLYTEDAFNVLGFSDQEKFDCYM